MAKNGVSVTYKSTLEKYVKTKTEFRVNENGVVFLVDELNNLVTRIVEEANGLVMKDERSTLLLEDMKKAADEVLRKGPVGVDELFEKIIILPVVELKELSKRVRRKAEEVLGK
jgi:histone H3/H4